MFIGLGMAAAGGAAGLALFAFGESVTFFKTPTELAAVVITEGAPPQRYRLGGCVEVGSIKKDGITTIFRITDGGSPPVEVHYADHLPDLFREGQGVVAEGSLGPNRIFTAATVLAKHDENYMPPDVASALKKQGMDPQAAGSEGSRMTNVCEMLTAKK
jgi:cytochrome c-type biogenesis protein CcmE